MPKVSEMFSGNYLKGADLRGMEPVVQIVAVESENVGTDDQPDHKWVVSFVGKKKGLILNKTNAVMLETLLQSDDTNIWIGKSVKLWNDPTVMFKGEMNGTEAAEQIRSQFDIPVVYLTAYADEKVLERAKVTEPFGYIMKPFEDGELNAAVEIALYKHKMEKKLKESEEWLFTTLNSIADAVIATDKEGHVTFMNPVAESLTGWQQEEAKGKPLQDVNTEANAKRIYKEVVFPKISKEFVEFNKAKTLAEKNALKAKANLSDTTGASDNAEPESGGGEWTFTDYRKMRASNPQGFSA